MNSSTTSLGFKMPKIKRRTIHKVFSVSVVVIFSAFLTSNLWLSVSSNIKPTPIGTSYNIQNISISLKQWIYNTDDNSMLIEIGTKDTNIDKNVSFGISVFDSAYRTAGVTVVFKSSNYFFLLVEDIPNSKVLHINVKLNISEQSVNNQKVTFTAIIYDIEINNEISTNSLTDNHYMVMDMENDINLLTLKRSDTEQLIVDVENKIVAANEKISNINTELKYMTDSETADAKIQISRLETSIENHQKSIVDYLEKIALINSEIEEKKHILEAFKLENGL